ncbi:alpha/beta hydrolase [Oscillatoria sp. FACHB-1407]|uniref:alpha/beta hydrolase n=1 Tax=Oscillatoria sp. FACHB-1407 TaxID=2692847 RepID=UPI00168473BB|nr:alpha/beta hydrolase [Oscillatoria sp. FACHB-1407]MBD2463795.1 alpha/beta hydrolase [Oscillatoria sp. FACHB-1407]
MGTQKTALLNRWIVGSWSWWRLGRSLLLIYLILCLYIWFTADRKIFLPPAATYSQMSGLVTLQTSDQVSITALYLPNPQATHTLLYSHGNAEDLGIIRPILEQLRQTGLSVLAYDYQGYGTSQGRPSEQGSYRDIEAAYRYLRETLGIPSDRIVIHGRSVGGGPSVYLASQQAIAGLILESTFTSAFRVVLPFNLFPFDKFPNLARLRQVTVPMLVIHGTDDTTIPLWHGETLYAAAPEPKQHWWVEGAGHNDVVLVGGADYGAKVRSFVDSL